MSIDLNNTQPHVAAQTAANPAAVIAPATSNIGSPVADLVAARAASNTWRNGAYATSNQELYGILRTCLTSYAHMSGKYEQVAAFKAQCALANLKFTKNTPLINRVVEFVFGGKGKRVSSYARVLARAHADKIDPMNLHIWIADEGGIEQIRAKQAGRLTTKQRAEAYITKGLVAAHALKVQNAVKFDNLNMVDADTPYVAVLARVNANGLVELLAPINDKTVVDAALAAYGAETVKAAAASLKQSEIASTNDAVIAGLAA